jgi:hypothetical protein
MYGDANLGWETLAPRLPQSGEVNLWIAALVGQRIQGFSAREVRDWITRSSFGHARFEGVDIAAVYLNCYIIDDRMPTDEDVVLATELAAQPTSLGLRQQAAVQLQRLAFAVRGQPSCSKCSLPRSTVVSAKPGRAEAALLVATWRQPVLANFDATPRSPGADHNGLITAHPVARQRKSETDLRR